MSIMKYGIGALQVLYGLTTTALRDECHNNIL